MCGMLAVVLLSAVCLQALSGLGLKVLSWAELEVMGKTKPAPPQPPKPGDLSTIMYTSGTTGE